LPEVADDANSNAVSILAHGELAHIGGPRGEGASVESDLNCSSSLKDVQHIPEFGWRFGIR